MHERLNMIFRVGYQFSRQGWVAGNRGPSATLGHAPHRLNYNDCWDLKTGEKNMP